MSSDARTRFRSLLEAEAARTGLPLTRTQFDQLETHFALLEKWNPKVRLIGRTTPEEVVRRHTLESIALVAFIPSDASTLLDVGSGNGFPAVPIKCVREDLRVVMVEPVLRKGAFLKQVVSSLNLTGISVRRGRIDKPEDLLGESGEERWDIITMRAVAVVPILMKGAPVSLRPGGRLLVLTGESGRAEIRRRITSPLRMLAEQRLPHTQASYIVAVERRMS